MKRKIISLLLAGALVFSQGSWVIAADGRNGASPTAEASGENVPAAKLTEVEQTEKTTLANGDVRVVYRVTGENMGTIGVRGRRSVNGKWFTPEESTITQEGTDREKTVTVTLPKNADIYSATYQIYFWPTEGRTGLETFRKGVSMPEMREDTSTKISEFTASVARIPSTGGNVGITLQGSNLTTSGMSWMEPKKVAITADAPEVTFSSWFSLPRQVTFTATFPANETETDKVYRLTVTPKDGGAAKSLEIVVSGTTSQAEAPAAVLKKFVQMETGKDRLDVSDKGGTMMLQLSGENLNNQDGSVTEQPDGVQFAVSDPEVRLEGWRTSRKFAYVDAVVPANTGDADKTYTITATPKAGGESKTITIVVKKAERAEPDPALDPSITKVEVTPQNIGTEGGPVYFTVTGENLTKENYTATVRVFEGGEEVSSVRVNPIKINVENAGKTGEGVFAVPVNETKKEREYRLTVTPNKEGAKSKTALVTQAGVAEEEEEEQAGWKEDSIGKWYRYADGSYPKGQMAEIEGELYHFNAQGYLECCRWIQADGHWYYLTGESKAQKGWSAINGSWYFFDKKTAKMQTGWVKEGDTWYFLDRSGAMKTGWIQDGGAWYFLDGSGAMQTGWLQDGGKWYLLAKSGAMEIGWAKEGDTWYFLDRSGAMKTGWVQDGGNWYFLNGSGAMQTGWVLTGGNWYFLNESGAMQTGWLKQGSTWYYLKADGSMAAATVLRVGGTNYRFAGSGAWIG